MGKFPFPHFPNPGSVYGHLVGGPLRHPCAGAAPRACARDPTCVYPVPQVRYRRDANRSKRVLVPNPLFLGSNRASFGNWEGLVPHLGGVGVAPLGRNECRNG